MTFTPIALFVYKRPEHTRKTLESLMANAEFSDSPFYVFCDGARNEKDILLVQETRKVIRSYKLENITVIERNECLGLANSIIAGVTDLCNKYGRVIVVEDDLCLSPYTYDTSLIFTSGTSNNCCGDDPNEFKQGIKCCVSQRKPKTAYES